MKLISKILTFSGIFLFLTTSLMAQSDIKDRIETQASLVLQNVQSSDATDIELREIFQQLRQINLTLNTSGGGGGGNSNQLFCEPRSSSYSYLTRVRDGFRFGTDVSTELCQQQLTKAKNGLVCGPRSSSYAYIYNIATGEIIGTDVQISECNSLIASSNRQLVCKPRSSSYAYVAKIRDGQQLGTDVQTDLCKEIISKSTKSVRSHRVMSKFVTTPFLLTLIKLD